MISNQQNAIAAECPSGTPTTSFEVRVWVLNQNLEVQLHRDHTCMIPTR
jgi:hypothetical protein